MRAYVLRGKMGEGRFERREGVSGPISLSICFEFSTSKLGKVNSI